MSKTYIDPTLTAIEWVVTDQTGVFHGQLINVWTAAASSAEGEDFQMFTFAVTGVGFGYSDHLDVGDQWTIVAKSIASMTPLGR